jgi:hypothetical protein
MVFFFFFFCAFDEFRRAGKVYLAENKETGERVALKKMVFDTDDEGIPSTALREVSLLKELTGHPNVVALLEVIYLKKTLYLVFPHLETDLKRHMETTQVTSLDAKVSPRQTPHHHKTLLSPFFFCMLCSEIHMAIAQRRSLLSQAAHSPSRFQAAEHSDFQGWRCSTGRLWSRPRLFAAVAPIHERGRHAVVPRARDSARAAELLDTDRFVVHWRDLLRNDHKEAAVSGRLGDRSAVPHLQDARHADRRNVARRATAAQLSCPSFRRIASSSCARCFPEYAEAEAQAFALMEEMLIFNPARRISVKAALNHAYFVNLETI